MPGLYKCPAFLISTGNVFQSPAHYYI